MTCILDRFRLDEQVTIELVQSSEGWELRVSCLQLETHAAHAAGAGGVALMSAAAWLIGGWTGGLLPALATALAGGLWADVTRAVAMQRLEQQLRDLTESVGLALWPDAPAQDAPPTLDSPQNLEPRGLHPDQEKLASVSDPVGVPTSIGRRSPGCLDRQAD